MLNLTLFRKRNEVILEIPPTDKARTVRVLLLDDNRDSQAKVGIDAPPDIQIYRQDQKRKRSLKEKLLG